MKSTSTFIVLPNGGELNLSILWTELEWARELEWTKSIWKCKPALVELNGQSSRPYIGQKFDHKHFKIIEDFWTHEHCAICVDGIVKDDIIYESSDNIICTNCFQNFILPEDVEVVIEEMEKIER